MKKLFVWAVLLLITVACLPAVSFENGVPPYLVMLTSVYPDVEGRCTGIAISSHYIITAQHCLTADSNLKRVITQTGQEGAFIRVSESNFRDVMLVKTVWTIDLPQYASFTAADRSQPATIFAVCPLYLLNSPRPVKYYEASTDRPIGSKNYYVVDVWRALDNKICGGDSGGAVVQAGKVVGLVHTVRSPWPWFPVGKVVHTIPGERVGEWISIALYDLQGTHIYKHRKQ
jgi:hypothetical protein